MCFWAGRRQIIALSAFCLKPDTSRAAPLIHQHGTHGVLFKSRSKSTVRSLTDTSAGPALNRFAPPRPAPRSVPRRSGARSLCPTKKKNATKRRGSLLEPEYEADSDFLNGSPPLRVRGCELPDWDFQGSFF